VSRSHTYRRARRGNLICARSASAGSPPFRTQHGASARLEHHPPDLDFTRVWAAAHPWPALPPLLPSARTGRPSTATCNRGCLPSQRRCGSSTRWLREQEWERSGCPNAWSQGHLDATRFAHARALATRRCAAAPVRRGSIGSGGCPTRAHVQLWRRRSSSARSRSSIRRAAISIDLCSRHAKARNTWSLIRSRPNVCRLGAALERQGHLLDLDDAARRRERCEVVRHRHLPVTRLHRESVLFDLAGTVCERNGQRSIPNRVDNYTCSWHGLSVCSSRLPRA
jgi:hypothetical protein